MIKPKKRYILFQIKSETALYRVADVKRAVYGCFQELFGIIGLSYADLALVHFDEEKQLGILRCSHLQTNNVIASLMLIHQAENRRVSFITKKVSGTMRRLEES